MCQLLGQFRAIFDILHSSWHNQCKNHTLSGTYLAFKTLSLVAHCLKSPTLCGTEIGQNGTLADLAYAYCRQWEYPPGPVDRSGYALHKGPNLKFCLTKGSIFGPIKLWLQKLFDGNYAHSFNDLFLRVWEMCSKAPERTPAEWGITWECL